MAPRCSICEKPVVKTHRSVECNGCNQWCQIKCGKVSPSKYEEYTQLHSFDWLCPNCKDSETVDNDNVVTVVANAAIKRHPIDFVVVVVHVAC